MPPRRGKKVAPATPALDGCKIALSGTFPGLSQALIKTKAEALGATVATTVTDDTTHLVATKSDNNKPSPKVAKAQSQGIHIVSLDWLLLCEKNNAREAEKDHALDGTNNNNTAQDSAPAAATTSSQADTAACTTTRTRKRAPPPAADNASDNETAPKAKKTRVRKTAKADDEATVDDKTQDANDTADVKPVETKEKAKTKAEPVLGAGQVAKRKDIQIPLDEGCPFVSSTVYIDGSGVIFDASLNQTNASHNNNKFYRVQVGLTAFHVVVPFLTIK